MEDEIVRQINSYWEDTPEESWAAWRAGFMLKNPHQRIVDLNSANQWLEHHQNQHNHPDRELASMLTRKRELESIHWQLRKAGR